MKKNQRHIRFAWIVLICFLAGQYMAFTHQHVGKSIASNQQVLKASTSQQTITEKCTLCDMMHHTHMVLSQAFIPYIPVKEAKTRYTLQHHHTRIALILSAGRSPPLV